MILGLSIHAFTVLHVVISLIGIASGFIVLYGMFNSQRMTVWTALFLATTILTSLTGFLFPRVGFTPAQGVGITSLVVLAATLLALYVYHLAGAWRWIYVVGAVLALYLNIFVGVVQAFQKLPFLQALAPTQSEPPFTGLTYDALVGAFEHELGYLDPTIAEQLLERKAAWTEVERAMERVAGPRGLMIIFRADQGKITSPFGR